MQLSAFSRQLEAIGNRLWIRCDASEKFLRIVILSAAKDLRLLFLALL
jgi:hypothetical protein